LIKFVFKKGAKLLKMGTSARLSYRSDWRTKIFIDVVIFNPFFRFNDLPCTYTSSKNLKI